MNCPNCGGAIVPGSNRCLKCGSYLEQPSAPAAGRTTQEPASARPAVVAPPEAAGPAVKSKLAAGLLGIFLGGLGIHRFYLGYTGIGMAQLLLFLFGVTVGLFMCGVPAYAACMWGLIEGIMILVGSIDRDGQGRPLRD